MSIKNAKFSRRSVLKGAAAGAAGLAAGIYAPAILAQNKFLSIMVLGPDQKATEWMKGALAEFKAETGYDVELRQSDWGSAFQRLLTAAASGTMADVTMMGQVMTPALASRGAFLPIDERLAAWDDTDKFYPAMLQDGTYDGRSYALPVYADVRTAVYRSDMLEQVGVGADALPTSWDEFKALAIKLSKSEGGPLDAPFFSGQDTSVGLMQTFSQMLYQANGSFFDESGKSVLSSEPGMRALEYLVSFFAEGLANPNLVYQGTGPRPMVQGRAAMAYNSANESANAAQNAPEVQQYIVAGQPLSADAGGEPRTIAWINKFGIGANTADPDGAWALLSFIASKEQSAKVAELWGGLPARTDQADAPYLANVDRGFVEATQYAGALPTAPNLLQIQQQVNIAMQAAIRQSGGEAAILADLDRKIDEINAA
ncbi:extracellular solute-binding protein [Devosia nitrariae]|uniref:ABC transporter substrate-binding protein n=1 Tax=Devosia nitrariae TaxID=2071872 RepID=A0ABQ5W707_9HYPH|nr:extracellular solute-binding protein [Devosia nitrariae]GLQ55865.1 ABC transporter substrate-binding protein [Devosia nitrariae]